MNVRKAGSLCRKRVASLGAGLMLSGAVLWPGQGLAQSFTLSNGDATATIDLNSSAGMNRWTVDGQNQLNQQWFWYRTDNGIAQPINTIGGLQYQLAGNDQLDALFQNAQLSVEVIYQLTGGSAGSGTAGITEQIVVVNQSSGVLNLNFYQYADFNLLGAASDNIQILGSPGAYDNIRQWNGLTAIQEAINFPNAVYAEAAPVGQTLAELNGTSNLNLNGNLTAGPGAVTWALQWDAALAANGGEFSLTKNQNLSVSIVPEPPATATIILSAGVLTLVIQRLRSRRID